MRDDPRHRGGEGLNVAAVLGRQLQMDDLRIVDGMADAADQEALHRGNLGDFGDDILGDESGDLLPVSGKVEFDADLNGTVEDPHSSFTLQASGIEAFDTDTTDRRRRACGAKARSGIRAWEQNRGAWGNADLLQSASTCIV